MKTLTNKAMVNLQKAAVASVSAMDKAVQEYLENEVFHIEKHRNPTRLNEFFAQVQKTGSRAVAMHAYVQTFANIQLDPESKQYVMKKERVLDATEFEQDVRSTLWHTMKPNPEPQQFDIAKRLNTLIQGALKANEASMLVGADGNQVEKLQRYLVDEGLIEKAEEKEKSIPARKVPAEPAH